MQFRLGGGGKLLNGSGTASPNSGGGLGVVSSNSGASGRGAKNDSVFFCCFSSSGSGKTVGELDKTSS